MKYEKGKVNNHFIRYLGTVESIPLLFFKSLGDRKKTDLNSLTNEYYIFDTPSSIIDLKKNIKSKDYFDLSGLIDKFSDIEQAWQIFLSSKFYFHFYYWPNDNIRFLNYLGTLSTISTKKYQYVDLRLPRKDLSDKIYTNLINDCLHALYMRSFRDYSSVVRIIDEQNVEHEDFVGRLYSKMNPTFCILPWIHLQYKPTGQSKLCCRFDLNKPSFSSDQENLSIQNSKLENTFKSSQWAQARTLMLDNQKITGCHKCYKEESGDTDIIGSMRLGSNILYNGGYLHKFLDQDLPKIKYLEIGFGNYCNMACLTCNSTLSTTWHEDEVKFNSTLSKDSTIRRIVFPKLENLKFDLGEETLGSLTLIKFTGGEPMINPEFIKFVDLLCDKGHPEQITLEIYTNCSYIPSPKLTQNLAKFKTVLLNLSIDAYGKANDYIRYGSQWNTDTSQSVSRSLDFWLNQGKNNKNIRVNISSTLSVLNVFEMPKLISWWMDEFKKSGNQIIEKRSELVGGDYEGFFKIQPAFDPRYLDVGILPRDSYKEVEEWIENYKQNYLTVYPEFKAIPESLHFSLGKLENTIKKAKGNKESVQRFVEYITAMDKIRNLSINDSLPILDRKVKEFLSS